LGLEPTILTQALEAKNYLLAPESGIFEICVELGSKVSVDEPLARIHYLERPDREPALIVSPKEGYLLCMRTACKTQQGDCIAVIAEAVSVDSLR
jgi:predicted deacylase